LVIYLLNQIYFRDISDLLGPDKLWVLHIVEILNLLLYALGKGDYHGFDRTEDEKYAAIFEISRLKTI
jgi:hypothetical protein